MIDSVPKTGKPDVLEADNCSLRYCFTVENGWRRVGAMFFE